MTSIRPPPTHLVMEPLHLPSSSDTSSSTNEKAAVDSNDGTTLNASRSKGIIVMLHGWAQNVHVFYSRTRKLRKRLNKSGYKVVYIQAPHLLPPVSVVKTSSSVEQSEASDNPSLNSTTSMDDAEGEDDASVEAVCNPSVSEEGDVTTIFSREYAYGWFIYNPQNPSDTTPYSSSTGNYHGMDESLQYIQKEIHKLVFSSDRDDTITLDQDTHKSSSCDTPPIFLLGFSQGAVMVHKIAKLACTASTKHANENDSTLSKDQVWGHVQKCVLVGGFSFYSFISIDRCHQDDNENSSAARYSSRPIIMPSLHVIGKQDKRVGPSLSRQVYELEPCFGGKHFAKIWEHDRGHVVPQNQEVCNYLVDFLEDKV